MQVGSAVSAFDFATFVFLDVVFMIRLAPPQTKLWEPKDQAGSIVIF